MNICEQVFIEQDTNSTVASIAKKIEQVDTCDACVSQNVLGTLYLLQLWKMLRNRGQWYPVEKPSPEAPSTTPLEKQ